MVNPGELALDQLKIHCLYFHHRYRIVYLLSASSTFTVWCVRCMQMHYHQKPRKWQWSRLCVLVQIWVSLSWRRWFLVISRHMSWLLLANTVHRFAFALCKLYAWILVQQYSCPFTLTLSAFTLRHVSVFLYVSGGY